MLNPSRRAALRELLTVAAVVAAWFLAFLLRFDADVPADRVGQLVASLPLVVLVQLATLHLAGATRHSWRYTTMQDLVPLTGAVVGAGASLALIRLLAPTLVAEWPTLGWLMLPYGVIGGYMAIVPLGLIGLRVLRRALAEQTASRELPSGQDPKRVLLVGAGQAGVIVARELQARPDLGMVPVAFVDDDREKLGRRISRIDVCGTTDDLARLIQDHRIDEVVITIASSSGAAMRQLIARVDEAGRHPLVVPGLYEIVGGTVSLTRFRRAEPEDLLGREAVELDLSSLDALVGDEVVMVTGAGGSIGSELCRQVIRFGPRRLVLIERSEPAMWAVHRELAASLPELDLVAAVADVADAPRMDALLLAHKPSVILHAAAHKHVPMMEDNPGEAVKNNVLGTRALVDRAVHRGVERFVLISTDKAVNPTSVMGATKRLAERYVQHVAAQTGLEYVAVRFGNVLGSTGSVVPIFEEQIAAGGPVTVTDPEMRRYFMTIPEAAQLVLQAAALGHSGEVLVLDMGEPVRIVELAESMIRLSGMEPHTDIAIEFTGLRPGEKLFEELSLSEEAAERTRHPKIWIGRTLTPDWGDVDHDLDKLRFLINHESAAVIRAEVAARVPEFVDVPPPPPVAAPPATPVSERARG